ncbi:hypothetical protein NECAME_00573 [Necator americanus]|uniref:Uncharacterized protein n=1 Tax=Necator americanus TaxID=51031 RepID=W2T2F7_NECAM|nr:hypothetical protein NECAME_00573 [Necator americanus]ETN75162.1 hypothetical protein NECAME_00573 [Necator americanus]
MRRIYVWRRALFVGLAARRRRSIPRDTPIAVRETNIERELGLGRVRTGGGATATNSKVPNCACQDVSKAVVGRQL